jgi:hypothetical protein
MARQHTGPLTNRVPQRQRMSARGRRIAKRVALTVFIVIASLSALVWARFRPAIAPAASANSGVAATTSIVAEQPSWGSAMVSATAPSIVSSDDGSAQTGKGKAKGKRARQQRQQTRSVAQTPR